jgi:N-acetylneuraminate lyase
MAPEKLKGLIAAPFSPMNEDGTLNLSVIPDYYYFLKENGVTGAFICGSTGEGASLTMKEKKAAAEAWAQATGDDNGFKVITLVGGACLEDCRELARHAWESGLYAIAFTSPYYFKPSNADVLADCCESVAEVVPDMPFYYYHIPVLTGGSYQMLDLLKAVNGRIRNFAGIKYTHEDFMDFLACSQFDNKKFDMLWGRDECMLSALATGAQGAVGSTYNYAAPVYHEMIEAFNKGDLKSAQVLQQTSIEMINLLGKYGGIATGKAYMKLVGIDCGKFRLPVKNMSEEEFELFEKEVESISFRTYCSKMPAPTRMN